MMFQAREIVPAAVAAEAVVLVGDNAQEAEETAEMNVQALADAYAAFVVAAAATPANGGSVVVETAAETSVRDLRMRFEGCQGPFDARHAVAQSSRVGRLAMNRFGRFGVDVAASEEEDEEEEEAERQQVRQTGVGGDAVDENKEEKEVTETAENMSVVMVAEEEEEDEEKKTDENLAKALADMEQDVKLAVAEDLLDFLATDNSLAVENSNSLASEISSDLLAVSVKVEEKVRVVNAAEEHGEKGVVGNEENAEAEDKKNGNEAVEVAVEKQSLPCAADWLVRIRPDHVEVFEQEKEEQQPEQEEEGEEQERGEQHDQGKERGALGVGDTESVDVPRASASGDTALTGLSHIQATTAGVSHDVDVDVDVDLKPAAAMVEEDVGRRRGRTAGDYAWLVVAWLILPALACLQWLAVNGCLVIASVAAVALWLGHRIWHAGYTLVGIAWIGGPVAAHKCSRIVVAVGRFLLAAIIRARQSVHHQQVGVALVDLAAAVWIAMKEWKEWILAVWQLYQVLRDHVLVPRWIVARQVGDGRLTNPIRDVNARLSVRRRNSWPAKLTHGNVKVNAKSKLTLKLKLKSKRKPVHRIETTASEVCVMAHGPFAIKDSVVEQPAQQKEDTETYVEMAVTPVTMAMEQQQPAPLVSSAHSVGVAEVAAAASTDHVVEAAVLFALCSSIAPPPLARLDPLDTHAVSVGVPAPQPQPQPQPHAQAQAQEQHEHQEQQETNEAGGRRPKQQTRRRIDFGRPYKTDVDSVYMKYNTESPSYVTRQAEGKQKRLELEKKSKKKTCVKPKQ